MRLVNVSSPVGIPVILHIPHWNIIVSSEVELNFHCDFRILGFSFLEPYNIQVIVFSLECGPVYINLYFFCFKQLFTCKIFPDSGQCQLIDFT
jgi:hypothetical protein